MFDDPKKELQRLQQALLEEAEGEYTEFYDAYSEDNDSIDEDDFPLRNAAVDFSRTLYDDEEFDESKAVVIPAGRKNVRRASKKQKKQARRQAKLEKKKKKKGIGGLILLALLEIMAILILARWWIQWLT